MSFLPLFSAAATSLWLAVAYLYIADQIGWHNVHALLFHEQALLWVTIFVPIGFLWLTVAMTYRNGHLHDRIDRLTGLLNAFIEPAGKKNQYAKKSLDDMKEQAQALEGRFSSHCPECRALIHGFIREIRIDDDSGKTAHRKMQNH